MKNMNKLLGMSLAIIMVLGSVPLGFSEPLRVQLEQGIETENIQCNNPDHVLVLRTNGNAACVTERTALKTGWEIITTTSKVSYDFPITAKSAVTPATSESSAPSSYFYSADVEISISHLPKIGETAELTATFTNAVDLQEIANFEPNLITFKLGNGLEFVDTSLTVEEVILGGDFFSNNVSFKLENPEINATNTITTTIRATQVTPSYVSASLFDDNASLSLVISENETLLKSDYIDLYGAESYTDLATPTNPNVMIYEETIIIDGVEQTNIVEEIIEDESNLEDQTSNATTLAEIVQEWLSDGASEKEVREILEDAGHTDQEINDALANVTVTQTLGESIFNWIFPEAHASSHTFIFRGKITNPPSQYDPSTSTNVHGIKVCAADKNLSTNAINIIHNTGGSQACTHTSQTGFYYITNIVANDPDNDGTTVDLYLYMSTNGRYVDIKSKSVVDSTGNIRSGSENSGFYAGRVGVSNNIVVSTTPITKNFNLQAFSFFDRAVWLLDTLQDTREFFDDNGERIAPVIVVWQYNEDLTDFLPERLDSNNAVIDQGAHYKRGTSTIPSALYLDGTDPNSNGVLGDEHRTWTQIHEYGHHTMRDMYGLSGWGGCLRDQPHYIYAVNLDTCAWSEGWADFVPHLVSGEFRLQWTDTLLIDLEENRYYIELSGGVFPWTIFAPTNANDPEIGHLVEGRVASMLWDVNDTPQHILGDRLAVFGPNLDTLDFTERNIIDNAKGTTKSIVKEFNDAWDLAHRTSTMDNLERLHHMGFPEPPIITPIGPKSIDALSELRFTVIATDANNDNLQYNLGALSPSGASINSASGLFIWTPTLSQVGTHQVIFNVSDGALSDREIVTITVNQAVDNTDPQITITQPVTGTHYYTSNNRVTVGGTSSDNVGVTSITFLLNDVNIGSTSSNLDNWSFGPFTVPRSSNTLHVDAEDAAGNTSRDTLFILYSDPSHNSPPKTSRPTSSFVTSSSVTVNWVAPVSIPTIDQYDVFRASSPKVLIATVPATQLSYTDGAVLPGTNYDYTISAKNQYGSGVESDPLSVRTLDIPQVPPVFDNPISDVLLNEGDSTTFQVLATDVNNDNIVLSLSNSPDWVSINDNGDGTGIVTIDAPRQALASPYQATVVATDDDGFDSDTFTIDVTQIDLPPTLEVIVNTTGGPDSALRFHLTGTGNFFVNTVDNTELANNSI